MNGSENSSHEILHDLSNRRSYLMHGIWTRTCSLSQTNYYKRREKNTDLKELCFWRPCKATIERERERKSERDEPETFMNEANACERNFFATKSTNCPDDWILFLFLYRFCLSNLIEKRETSSNKQKKEWRVRNELPG